MEKPNGSFIVTGYYGDELYSREVEIEKDDFNEAMAYAGVMIEEGGYAEVTDADGNVYNP